MPAPTPDPPTPQTHALPALQPAGAEGAAAPTREQLLDAVEEHFQAQQVEEADVIACFLGAIKRHRMGLPH